MNTTQFRPEKGHVVEIDKSAGWGTVQKLLGFDFGELGDEADHIIGYTMPGVIIGGDLHIDGDLVSTDLPCGRPGFGGIEGNYFVVVLGNLTVTGHLKVVQYHDLFVAGDLKAKSIRSISANLVTVGSIQADELVCFETSEEGGVMYGNELTTPLWVDVGCYMDIDLKLNGQAAATAYAEQRAALGEAAEAVSGQSVAGGGIRLFRAIDACITSGKGADFVEAYRRALAGDVEPAILSEVASDFGVVFQDDFTEFVSKFEEGLKIGEDPLPYWSKGANDSPAAENDHQDTDVDEIAALIGAKEMKERYYTFPQENGDCHFWNVGLLKHAYIVGKSLSGDPIVQVAQGKYAGKILHTNHENYYGYFECLAGGGRDDDANELRKLLKKIGIESLDDLSTDQVVEILITEELNGGWFLADSFAEFYACLCRHHGTTDHSGALVPFFTPGLTSRAYICGINVSSLGVFAVGGLGLNIAFCSRDDGESFDRIEIEPGTGLRSIVVDESEIWVSGERAFVACSRDQGKTWQQVDIGADVLANTILRAEGAIWTTGGFGAKRSLDGGKSWEKIAVDGSVSRPQAGPQGLLLPTSIGTLFRYKDGEMSQLPVKAPGTSIASATSHGDTILAVGAQGIILRSGDGGVSFTKVDSGVSTSLENVTITSDDRWVVVGESGVILLSKDDGQTFERVTHKLNDDWFFGLAPFRNGALIGGGATGQLFYLK